MGTSKTMLYIYVLGTYFKEKKLGTLLGTIGLPVVREIRTHISLSIL